MSEILVVGYGNSLRGDDGLGPRAIERLAETLPGERVQLLSCHQLTLDLIDPIGRAGFVIFIDASYGDVPGTVTCTRIEPPGLSPASLSHQVDPPTLLACARGLYGTCPEAVVLSVAGSCFDFGEELSPPVSAALEVLLRQVQDLVAGRLTAVYSEDGAP